MDTKFCNKVQSLISQYVLTSFSKKMLQIKHRVMITLWNQVMNTKHIIWSTHSTIHTHKSVIMQDHILDNWIVLKSKQKTQMRIAAKNFSRNNTSGHTAKQ
jgi:hypothetical protein